MFAVAVWLWLRPEPTQQSKQWVDRALTDADILIDLSQQILFLKKNKTCYFISSGKNGIGETENSGKTPTGWHCIAQKIGHNVAENTVFVGRAETGEIYDELLDTQQPNRDWILTRILWLKGLEEGINLGEGVDTFERYIYIHGTPEKNPMGIPLSHGCIRMHNTSLIEIFNTVDENALVYLSKEPLNFTFF
ncbi:L,D-transpeptidase [Acinetobacter sp. B5B]|nr:L,D-transpeptidase [Acinetobacter baretiae]MBF7684788.1 L,D-transpeptidase [Acinetobacter baretiae]